MRSMVLLLLVLVLVSSGTASDRVGTLDGTGRPYLLLNPPDRRLELWTEAHLLASWPILRIETAVRRDLLGRRPGPSWPADIWTRGRAIPECPAARVELDVTHPDYEVRRKEALVPPSPEEQCPAPNLWWITFENRRSLEINTAARDREPGGRWLRSLRARRNDRIRIRLLMDPEVSGSLYRAVPDSVSFAVKD